MEYFIEVVLVFITSLTSVVIALISKGYFDKWRDKKKSEGKRPVEKQVQASQVVNLILQYLIEQINCDRAYIYQFHNGSYFYTLSPIQHMSITHEVTKDNVPPIQTKNRDFMVSQLSKYIADTINLESFHYNQIYTDVGLKAILQESGTQSHISIPIYSKNDTSKRIVGIVSFDWTSSEVQEKHLNPQNTGFSEDFKHELMSDIKELEQYL